jgi:hypothetical protein
MATRKKAKRKPKKEQDVLCPLCLLVGSIKDMVDTESPFFKHMRNARIEFLEGLKVLIEDRIEAMKKGTESKRPTLTKIKVEE